MVVLRLSGSHQDPERCRYVCRPHLHIPGHLYPARPGQGHSDREAGSGAHRPHGHEVPHG